MQYSQLARSVVAIVALYGWMNKSEALASTVPTLPAGSQTITYAGTISTPSGKPAAGAIADIVEIDYIHNSVVSQKSVSIGSDGSFNLLFKVDPVKGIYPIVDFSSPEGVALPQLDFRKPISKGQIVTLLPVTNVTVRVVDDLGNPVSGTKVYPEFFFHDGRLINWNPGVSDRWTAVCDSAGNATFHGLPQGWQMRLEISDEHYAQPGFTQDVMLAKSAQTPPALLTVGRAGAISGRVTYADSNLPASGVPIIAMPVDNSQDRYRAVTDSSGVFTMSRVGAGSYELYLNSFDERINTGPLAAYTALKQSVSLSAGGSQSNINLTLIHGGVVAGSVIDVKTGKPIPNLLIDVTGTQGQQAAETDAQGKYSLHVAPGDQTVFLYPWPGMGNGQTKSVTVADGGTQTVNFKSTPPAKLVDVNGTVIGAHGTPIAGATVTATGQGQGEIPQSTVTDARGHFSFPATNMRLTPDMLLFADSDNDATLSGTAVGNGKNITLKLSPNERSTFTGCVVDQDGKPLAGANVMIFRSLDKNMGGHMAGTAVTDNTGRYLLKPHISTGSFSIDATLAGYGSDFVQKSLDGIRGKTQTFPIAKLNRADSFVGGKVIDISGNPIPEAIVSLPQMDNLQTSTDSHGRFHLANASRGHVILQVRAADDRFASIMVQSGTDNDVITAENRTEQEAEGKRFIALRDADPDNHGNGANAKMLLRAACLTAATGHKAVIIIFHASWCGPCFVLHHFLKDPTVAPIINAHFVVQSIDIWEHPDKKAWENPGGTGLYAKYGGTKADGSSQGVPFTAILDASGSKLTDSNIDGENVGYPSSSADEFLARLKKASPTLSDDDIATLKDALIRDENP
jgi:hypothetical protein